MTPPLVDFGGTPWEFLQCSVDERGVGWLRLNRPPANALNLAMVEELTRAVRAARFDPHVKVVVLASAVPGFFSSGLDIAELESFDANRLELLDHLFKDLLVRPIRTARKLFVALIEGHCLGGGLELALAADLRLGMDGSWKLGLPEIRLGGMPGGGGIQMLSRLVGPSAALQMVLKGQMLTPREAADLHLLDRLVDDKDVADSVDRYLGELAAGPQEAQAAVKLALREGLEQTTDGAMVLERELYRGLYGSPDLAEGVRSFREKRSPSFGKGSGEEG
jgi:enoyl-CoA hydratase/carnithine racemase